MSSPPPLVLGPLLRHVDDTSAAVWVETASAATVTVRAGDRTWSAKTFGVHGHHYALVEVTGLEPATVTAYAVEVDGATVWPPAADGDLHLPAPVIATLGQDRPLQLAFGSCRTAVPHDEAGNRSHGVDAMRAFALALAGATEPEARPARPDLLLFLGDQVYADETTDEMRAFIEARRDIDAPPGTELADFEEYAHLYRLAWSDPVNRWLLSTVPTLMIFDDHDVRDDWNTSQSWREQMAEKSWWHGRIVAALASYWVYQHVGNLSLRERAEDEIWSRVAAHTGPEELDLSEVLDAFADRVDREPESYRWSFARDVGRSRLVVVDSRAARVLDPARRAMLDEPETRWLDEQMRGDVDHLLVGTSLPFLMPDGLHHLEAFSEALAEGAWGRPGARLGEWLRQIVDLEHWPAFQRSFADVARMAVEVAVGRRGRPPRTVTFLSGDVHHSYVSEVRTPPGAAKIVQAVCSPIRNPLPRQMRFATAAMSYGVAGPIGWFAAKSAKVPDAPFRWRRVRGPWFDNNLALLEERPDRLVMTWGTGVVRDGAHDRPTWTEVSRVEVEQDGPGS